LQHWHHGSQQLNCDCIGMVTVGFVGVSFVRRKRPVGLGFIAPGGNAVGEETGQFEVGEGQSDDCLFRKFFTCINRELLDVLDTCPKIVYWVIRIQASIEQHQRESTRNTNTIEFYFKPM
jgi:hypothetical protein